MRLNLRHGTNFLNAFALDPDGDVFEIAPFADSRSLATFTTIEAVSGASGFD
jgi:hypothetical protein